MTATATLKAVMMDTDGVVEVKKIIKPKVIPKENTRRDFWEHIDVTDMAAVMSSQIFNTLPTYVDKPYKPMAVRVGARWKVFHDPVWYMCEYIKPVGDTISWSVKFRVIKIKAPDDQLALATGECTGECGDCKAPVRTPTMSGCRPWIRHRPGCTQQYRSVQEAVK